MQHLNHTLRISPTSSCCGHLQLPQLRAIGRRAATQQADPWMLRAVAAPHPPSGGAASEAFHLCANPAAKSVLMFRRRELFDAKNTPSRTCRADTDDALGTPGITNAWTPPIQQAATTAVVFMLESKE